MLTILKNEPLLFIQAPPVYVRITFTDDEDISTKEESTSIYVPQTDGIMQDTESETVEAPENEQEVLTEAKPIDPSVIRRVMYLASAFPRQIYKPLQFQVSGELVSGTIEKIEGDSVFVELEDEEKSIVPLNLREIEDILWRGTSFQDT